MEADEVHTMDSMVSGERNREFQHRYGGGGYSLHFPLTFFDDVEVAIRVTLAVVALAAICLYEDDTVVAEEYPLCFLALVVAVAVSLIPFAGAVLCNGASFVWGAFLGTIAVIIVTQILGDDIQDTLVPFPGPSVCTRPPLLVPAGTPLPASIPVPPFNATQVFVDVPGTVGDPSAVGLGFLIFAGTFLFVYAGSSRFFILGACIVYNFYLATWYSGTQAPLRPVPDIDQFFRYTRTILIGWAFIMAAFLLPLPRLLPTWIPQPRFACSVIFSQLAALSKKLSASLQDIVALYLDAHEHAHEPDAHTRRQRAAVLEGRCVLLERVLDEHLGLCRKLLKLLKLAAQYEPLWFPLPLLHATTVKRLQATILCYQSLIIYQSAMLRALQQYLLTCDGQPPPALPQDLLALVEEFSAHVDQFLAGFHYLGNPFFCCYSSDHAQREQDLARFSQRFRDVAEEQLSVHSGDGHSGEGKDAHAETAYRMKVGFHTYFFWCLFGVSHTLHNIEHLRQLPPQRLRGVLEVALDWPLHLLGWALEYGQELFQGVRDIVNLLRCKKNAGPIKFVERHYARFLGALVVALAATLAFLFILIDEWRTRLPTGTTVVIIAIATIDRDQPSGGFRIGILRLAGTTLGIAAAFCIVIFFDDTPDDGLAPRPIILSTMVFCLVARLIMQNTKYLYLSYTFLTTVIVLLYAVSVDFNTFVGFSGLRAVAIGIGITISTLCMLLWPISAALRLRRRVAKVVRKCGALILDSLDERGAIEQVDERIALIQKLTFQQEEMAKNAELEPDLFSRPFPVEPYHRMLRHEKALLQDTFILAKMVQLTRLHRQTADDETHARVRQAVQDTQVSPHVKQALARALDALQWRIRLATSDPAHSQAAIETIRHEFLEDLPSVEAVEAIGDPMATVYSCALLFTVNNILLDLKQLNLAITQLVAHQLATAPPGFYLPPRSVAEPLMRRARNKSTREFSSSSSS